MLSGNEKSALFMIMGVDKALLYWTTEFYEVKLFSVMVYIFQFIYLFYFYNRLILFKCTENQDVSFQELVNDFLNLSILEVHQFA